MRTLNVGLFTIAAAALMLHLAAGTAAAAFIFTPSFLHGRWAFHTGPVKSFSANAPGDPGGVATAPRQDILRVGIIDWDGLGGATGRTIATTDDNAGQTVVIDFTWSGTYTVNTDGTGSLSITSTTVTDASCNPAQAAGICATFEGPETYAITISKKDGRVALMQTDNAGGGAKIFVAGEAVRQFRLTTPYLFTTAALRGISSFDMVPAKGFSVDAPGDPGGVATAPRQDVMRVGFINWNNGSGVAAGRTIATTDDNTGNTVVIDFTWLGTYSVNPDGTGTLGIIPTVITDASCTPAQPPGVCATLEGNEIYSFVISKSRARVFLIQTDNAGGGAKIFMNGDAHAR